tara:strand:- start:313 stop:900 length:588 start_codon:yes stop_codon:yes gene_type:complete
MIKPFDFYFDFVSPYTYLAHKQIREIEKKNNIKIIYKPILLGGLHKLTGITAQAFIPSKSKYMIRDCKMFAEKLNIKFKFNSYFPFSSLNLMRGVFYSQSIKKEEVYINKLFDGCWKEGLNLDDEKILNSLLKEIRIDFAEFKKATSDQKIKDKLVDKTQNAFTKGIFGAPSFHVNNKLFWGQDRIEFAIAEAQK